MRADWADYPLSVIATATASTAGGLLTLFVSLCVGTWAGFYAVDAGDLWPRSGEDWCLFWLGFMGPIGICCMRLWGLLYLGFLFWIGHGLIHRDTPRVRTAGILVLAQYVVTVLSVHSFDDNDGWGRRETVVGAVLLLCVLPSIVAGWRRSRRNEVDNPEEALTTRDAMAPARPGVTAGRSENGSAAGRSARGTGG